MRPGPFRAALLLLLLLQPWRGPSQEDAAGQPCTTAVTAPWRAARWTPRRTPAPRARAACPGNSIAPAASHPVRANSSPPLPTVRRVLFGRTGSDIDPEVGCGSTKAARTGCRRTPALLVDTGAEGAPAAERLRRSVGVVAYTATAPPTDSAARFCPSGAGRGSATGRSPVPGSPMAASRAGPVPRACLRRRCTSTAARSPSADRLAIRPPHHLHLTPDLLTPLPASGGVETSLLFLPDAAAPTAPSPPSVPQVRPRRVRERVAIASSRSEPRSSW